MTDRLGARLWKWHSSSSESLSNRRSILQFKSSNLPAAIPFPKTVDDVVLFLRRLIDPKNCSRVCQSRWILPVSRLSTYEKLPDICFLSIQGDKTFLADWVIVSRVKKKNKKTKQNKTGLIFTGVPWLCTRRLGESVNIFNHPCTTNDRLWSMKEICTLIRESLQVKYY